MKRVMKRLFLVAVFVMLFGLMGCGTTLTTNMSVSDNFAGSRTMDVSIDKTTFDENAPEDGFKQLAAETAENTPSCIKFSYEEKKTEYVFHFVMSFTSKEEYFENMLRIAKILTSRYDKVIFATTTPNDPTYEYNQNSDIEEYNALLVPKLQEMGIIINDLYSVVYPHLDEYICEDKIHLSEAGIKACAEQVVKVIKETAQTLI